MALSRPRPPPRPVAVAAAAVLAVPPLLLFADGVVAAEVEVEVEVGGGRGHGRGHRGHHGGLHAGVAAAGIEGAARAVPSANKIFFWENARGRWREKIYLSLTFRVGTAWRTLRWPPPRRRRRSGPGRSRTKINVI